MTIKRPTDKKIITQASEIATVILQGFERHFDIFERTNNAIIDHFKQQQWQDIADKTTMRMGLFNQRSKEMVIKIQQEYQVNKINEALWIEIKYRYIGLLYGHQQPELAETFFNSVFCRLFHRNYYNNQYIFLQPTLATEYLDIINPEPTYLEFYLTEHWYHDLIQVFSKINLALPIHNLKQDLRVVVKEVRRRKLLDMFNQQERNSDLYLQVLGNPLYRNKTCYVIGKLAKEDIFQPFVLAFRFFSDNTLCIDALLTNAKDIANIFSAARSSFVLKSPVPSATVKFLLDIVPGRDNHELYSGIGFQKHAKTDFYRLFLHHIKHSRDSIKFALGIRGMVMCVFTIGSFPYVFKVIRDKIEKNTTYTKVCECYQMVKNSDRVGRMIDTLEYSQVVFPLDRFSEEVVKELLDTCASSVEINKERNQLTIKHIYIERRMIPLNLYIEHAKDDARQQVIDDYGNCIRQLAAANIFPGDLFLKNFGITRNNRVVFYDYDEIDYVTACNFRDIPEPLYPEQELQNEPWYSVGDKDIFPEEFAGFLFVYKQDLDNFKLKHAELLTTKFWVQQQEYLKNGQIVEPYVYRNEVRLRN